MKSHDAETSSEAAATRDEREIRDLLHQAGKRSQVPPEDLAALRAAAHGSWQELVLERQRARFARFTTSQVLALAASLLVVAALAVWWRSARWPPAAPEVLATLERGAGAISVNGRALAVGSPLHRGDEISTDGAVQANERTFAVLRLNNGLEVRVDRDSRLALSGPQAVALRTGALYVDTETASNSEARGESMISITTDFGTVRDIGTRFEVRRSPDDLRVRVRDGSISVDRERTEPAIAARAGEEIALDSAGRVARQSIATDDPSWNWALAAAPPFELEGAHLDEFLRWIERESGWRIEAEDELAATFAEIELHGSIEGLTPTQAIEIVLPGSGLRYEVSAATLRVSRN